MKCYGRIARCGGAKSISNIGSSKQCKNHELNTHSVGYFAYSIGKAEPIPNALCYSMCIVRNKVQLLIYSSFFSVAIPIRIGIYILCVSTWRNWCHYLIEYRDRAHGETRDKRRAAKILEIKWLDASYQMPVVWWYNIRFLPLISTERNKKRRDKCWTKEKTTLQNTK